MHKFFFDRHPHNGMTYEDYNNLFNGKIDSVVPQNLSPDEAEQLSNTKLNFQRMSRINKTYKVNENLASAIKEIDKPQLWMILTELWCGDSAQNIPYIAQIAKHNPLIDLRILLRDENPDIMDYYLTNGTRGIPKLVAFDIDGSEIFQWGPRPKEAQELVTKAKQEGKPKKEFIELLHKWYAFNKGKNLEEEFLNLISASHYCPKFF
ncbi:MAG: thioredoxin family protein [Ignavibacteriales bacterium]|nr:thioredoxin family protein [Ignavibacteriales bacterium]